MFPGQFMAARRTQVPSSARPLHEGCNNPKRAKATLFRELPHLFWPISSSFCKDLGWAVRAGGKRPLKKESKSYFRKSCSQRAGRRRCLCTMGVPLHSLTNLNHSTDRVPMCPIGQETQLHCQQAEGLGPGRKDPPYSFLRSMVEQGRAASGQLLNSGQGKVCCRLHTLHPADGNKAKETAK